MKNITFSSDIKYTAVTKIRMNLNSKLQFFTDKFLKLSIYCLDFFFFKNECV